MNDWHLFNADCTDAVARVVQTSANPVIVTDPPFNVGYRYDCYEDRKGVGEYYAWLGGILSLCPCVVIHYPEALYRLAFQLGTPPERVVAWTYNSNTPRQHRDVAFFRIAPDFSGLGEYKNPTDKRVAALMEKGRKPIGYDWIYHDQIKNVSGEKFAHPCQMPLAVMSYIVATLPPSATIIDPFAGTGTTLVAAKRGGRACVGFEISPQYYAIAKSRMENDQPLFDLRPRECGAALGEGSQPSGTSSPRVSPR